jgi:hypothetical protein
MLDESCREHSAPILDLVMSGFVRDPITACEIAKYKRIVSSSEITVCLIDIINECDSTASIPAAGV